MSGMTPLQVWGAPQPGDMEALAAAHAALQLPWVTMPVVAVPAGPTRVLALRERPPFLCDYALIGQPENPVALQAGLRWVSTPDLVDYRATLILDTLQALLGLGVKEIASEAYRPPDPKVRFI